MVSSGVLVDQIRDYEHSEHSTFINRRHENQSVSTQMFLPTNSGNTAAL